MSADEFVINLTRCAVVFNSPFIDYEVENAFDKIQKCFYKLGKQSKPDEHETDLHNIEEIDDVVIEDGKSEEEIILLSCQKPFSSYFMKKLSYIYYCNDSSYPVNPYYNREWMNMMEKRWLSTVPFWTRILQGYNPLCCHNCHK
jgi:hypothetical protein